MDNWISKIPGCFGTEDKIFAGHALDEKRAEELRKLLLLQKVAKQEIEEAFEDWLSSQTWNVKHSETQMKRVKKYFDL